jgi:hypothetical protein
MKKFILHLLVVTFIQSSIGCATQKKVGDCDVTNMTDQEQRGVQYLSEHGISCQKLREAFR